MSEGLLLVEVSDAVLINRVLAGDDAAFSLLVARYRNRYARFALHMLGNSEDAEDVLQDTFIRAYRSLGRCADLSRFDSWLFSILINRCRTVRARRRRVQIVVIDDGELPVVAEEHPAEQSALREEIRNALTKLPAGHREAFLLRYVEELSYDQMAALTGVGISALKMRVKRACMRLRELLQEVYDA